MNHEAESPAPSILVLSSLFPSDREPHAGLFIRERMFRVARLSPLVVVSPRPWFPLQSVIRWFRPGYRPPAPRHTVQQGVDVYCPRFLAFPGLLRRLDGWFMALGALVTVRRLVRERNIDIIDAHFAFPDGYAARLLSRWLGLPYVVTLRGTEKRMCSDPPLRRRILSTLAEADAVVTVANSLRDVVAAAGADPGKMERVGNGVDSERFRPLPRAEARASLGIDADDRVLVSVGGLVPRKGFHRVIEILPDLLRSEPALRYLVVGGASPEGDFRAQLEAQAKRLGVGDRVQFLGAMAAEHLKVPLSAADVFVLATENEGWANVFLEAMACGLPVVSTQVGGNAEVVCRDDLGMLVPFGDSKALRDAVERALNRSWDREAIRAYAVSCDWNQRIDVLQALFQRVREGSACP